MYLPRPFDVADEARCLELVDAWSFGTLITSAGGELRVDHLPFLVDRERRCLFGHFARANDHWRHIEAADPLLVAFIGPNGYISPRWYADRELVPTWNFSAVHVRGTAALITGADELRDLVDRLSRRHEAGFAEPWRIDELPHDKLQAMLRAIVGFRINIERVEGKVKLSQNRAPADREGAMAGLRGLGTEAGEILAGTMAGAGGDER